MTQEYKHKNQFPWTKVLRGMSLILLLIGLILLLREEASLAAAPPSAAATVLTTVDSAKTDGFTSLVLNSSGNPVISYVDFTNDPTFELAVCNDAACTNPTLTTLDGSELAAFDNSLALNSSGFPVIAYEAASWAQLHIAVCSDAICSNPTFNNVVDGIEQIGAHIDVQINIWGS